MKICMLTTNDNPYDYWTHQDEWEAYETATGSRVRKMLGIFCYTSPDLSNAENASEMERAVDEIVKYDPIGTYVKIWKDVPDPE